MPLSDHSLSDVSLSPSDLIDPILFPPTPLSATTPVLGGSSYSPPLHGIIAKPGDNNPGRKRKSSPAKTDPDVLLKRQRNNVAAHKYRQKRIDRITELETEVEDIKKERDDLRIKLARQEAETAALKLMLQMQNGGGAAKA
ncbi:cyclic AMP-dependent transcription factor ATF-2 [Microdochium nivale]|nr:cyclic AMP-dependent transcription factor ATF-2 [Microdochium nivale]